jgi:hypothetical protein
MNTGLCLNDLRKMTPAFAGRQVKKFANLPGGRQDGALNGK